LEVGATHGNGVNPPLRGRKKKKAPAPKRGKSMRPRKKRRGSHLRGKRGQLEKKRGRKDPHLERRETKYNLERKGEYV